MRTGFALAIILLMSAATIAGELNAVVLNVPRIDKGKLRILPNDHGVDLEKYGISVHFYWLADEKILDAEAAKAGISTAEFKKRFAGEFKALDDTFIDALSKAKFLYITQYSAAAIIPLSQKQEYAEAVKKFLENGGTLYMDLFAVSSYASRLLDFVKVGNPSLAGDSSSGKNTGVYQAVPGTSAIEHPLLNFPHKIRGGQKGYGCYSSAFPGQLPLFVKESAPEFPAMLIQEKVCGKGRIIFCQIPAFFRNPASDGEAGKMLENILSYVYGTDIRKEADRKLLENGGPGEDI